MDRSPVRRTDDGRFEIDLDGPSRLLMSHLCSELEALLDSDSPLLVRLFPPPYGDDVERNQGYAALAVPELIEHRRRSLETLRQSVEATELDETDLMAWMRSINDLRLVLGTLLGIEDDDGPPEVAEDLLDTFGLYEFLGMLLEMIVKALAGDAEA